MNIGLTTLYRKMKKYDIKITGGIYEESKSSNKTCCKQLQS